MAEVIPILSLIGVPALCMGLYAFLGRRIKETERKNKAVELGLQALLRDRIIQAYNHYMDKEVCAIYAKENVENMYRQYHNLGGNGTVTKLYEEMMALPTEKKEEKVS